MLLSLLAAAGAAIQPAAGATEEPYARTSQNVIVPVQRERQRDLEEWGYADAVVDGDRVWLSGVVAGLRPDETIADQEAAFERAFQRIGDVLERSGAGFDGVVEMTSFHTDMPAQIEAFKKVKHRYIRGPFPAWTAIGVTRLVPDRGLVEIKIVARRRPGIWKIRTGPN
ncbi:RidA family protein [Sphingopyxis sp. Geo48]|uniref:RidA family protein n=1 Tax=Sphingopyxis sp. Geo48 TaxID=545241 RepID=UPI0024B6B722|nr:RidA family protein [Sphingopyxis sp. Geo48]